MEVSALQRLRNPLAGRDQLQFASSVYRLDQKPDQDSQAAAVNVINPAQIDQYLRGAGEELNQALAESRGFVAKHNSPRAANDKYITRHFAGHLQQSSPHPAA